MYIKYSNPNGRQNILKECYKQNKYRILAVYINYILFNI